MEFMTFRERKAISQHELEALFHKFGLKITNQRIEVYREVAERSAHPSAEDVYERVHERLPAISLNTVYRSLTTLTKKGLLRHVDHVVPKRLYDDNMELHHHFLCTHCGEIQDVYIDNVQDLHLEGLPEDVEVTVRIAGVCCVCSAKDTGFKGQRNQNTL